MKSPIVKNIFLVGAIIRFIISVIVIEFYKKDPIFQEKVDPILLFFIVNYILEWFDSNIPEFIVSLMEYSENHGFSKNGTFFKSFSKATKASLWAFINSYRRLGDFYAIFDKINDITISIILMNAFQELGYFTKTQTITLWSFLGLRTLGCFIWYFNRNEKTFFFFPNIFEALMLAFLILRRPEVPDTGTNQALTITGLVIAKMIQEYLMHYKQVRITV
jgi:hypothetical protein